MHEKQRAPSRRRGGRAALAVVAVASAGGCALPRDAQEPPPSALTETVVAVTRAHELVRFAAARPQQWTHRIPLVGLEPGEAIVGIDFRVARGVLYALSDRGRLFTLDTQTGRLSPLDAPRVALKGTRFGFDFNPVADRIRVVSDTGQNLRLHPDTGALAAADPDLSSAEGGALRIAGAGYTYNPQDPKLTTNYAIDLDRGALVMQGSLEGTAPAVSPNTGRIVTVGPLGTGALQDAAFDISDVRNTALAALQHGGRTRLYRIDLAGGRATLLGPLGAGGPLRGLAIEP